MSPDDSQNAEVDQFDRSHRSRKRKTCDGCGFTFYTRDRHGQRRMAKYDGRWLCASCRVTARLEDGDFS